MVTPEPNDKQSDERAQRIREAMADYFKDNRPSSKPTPRKYYGRRRKKG